MTALATVADVEARLDDKVEERTRKAIALWLEDASDAARFIGRNWTPVDCPRPVSRIVASAVARFARNPDRLTQTRSGDETIIVADPPDHWFTEEQEGMLRKIGNPQLATFGSIQISAWGTRRGHDRWYGQPVGGSCTEPIVLDERPPGLA